MNLQGSTISFPVRADARGTFVTTDDLNTGIEEAIGDVLETVQGERVECPDYGMPDYVFATTNSSFIHRFAYVLEQQLRAYVPLILDVQIKGDVQDGNVVVNIGYKERNSINAPGNMVFPVWRLQQ